MEKDALKICPFCKEQIPREAVKYRYCGEWLEENAKNPDARTASEIAPAPSANVTPQTDSSGGLSIENPARNFPASVRDYTNAEPPVRLAAVIRDVVIIQALIFIGGIITGVAVGNTNSLGLLINEGIAAVFLGTFGFAISWLMSRQ